MKKRGMLVVLFLIIFALSSMGSAEKLYVSFFVGSDSGGEAGESICSLNADGEVEYAGCTFLEQNGAFPAPPWYDLDDDEPECTRDFNERADFKLPSSQGCWAFAEEGDHCEGACFHDNDCGYITVVEGNIINGLSHAHLSYYTKEGWEQGWDFDAVDEDDPGDAVDMLSKEAWKLDNAGASHLCADDHFWHSCGSGGSEDEDVIAWAGDKMYKCSYDDFVYKWEELGFDNDNDGWTTKDGDCIDTPSNEDSGICSEIAFEPDDLESKGLTLEGIRAEMKNRCDGKVKYSACSACRNPGAAEMCGDDVDNDCKAQTSDHCHENQASCEQRQIGSCSDDLSISCYADSTICEEADAGECTFVQEGEAAYGKCAKAPVEGGEPKTCSLDVENDCGENGPCNPVAQGTAYNIYNEEFSWIDIKGKENKGYCCGYNGVSDAGTIAQNEDSESFVCLNKNKDIVSTEKSFAPEAIGIDEIFKNSNCAGKWCWVNSAPTNNQFKVVTIKKPGQQGYDVVSNKDEWFACNATIPEAQKTFKAGAVSNEELKAKSNRFYCYQEGDRWSWAECVNKWDDRANPSIKGRYTGEGLYTLPLSIIQSPEEAPETPAKGEENEYIRETLEGPTVTITYDNLYKKYYRKGFLDFTGYTHLNLMVRFVDGENNPAKVKDLKLPLAVNITIIGPNEGDVIYLQRNILGDVINTPFVDVNNKEATEGFMHVQVPIGEYKAVRAITITANAGNRIQVRNIYLTSDKPGASNLLCSGQGAQEQNSWLQDADAGNPNLEISGENLCTTLYGEKAWLGLDDEVVDTQPAANCCGNAKNEYYAGLSKGFVDPNLGSEAVYYGCWNSQSIASGDTIMDIQFNVSYFDTSYSVAYKDISLDAVGPIVYVSPVPEDAGNDFCPTISCEGAVENCKSSTCEGQYNPGGTCTVFAESGDEDNVIQPCTYQKPADFDGVNKQSFSCSAQPINLAVGETFRKLCEFTISDLGIDPETTEFGFKDVGNDLVEVLFYDLITQDDIGKGYDVWTDANDNSIISGPSVQILKGQAKGFYNHPLAVIARLKKNVYFPADVKSEQKEKIEVINYSCSKTECLFPLPGAPKYKVTNLHPDLYELYYVNGTLETLITQANQEFDKYVNLRVKRIAQQVLFYSEGEESTKDIGFYGCRAADFITNVEDKNNLQYCAVVGDKFCSFSEVHEEENNKDAFTIVNTWSGEGLTHVGYDTSALKQPEEGQNISAYYEATELVLKSQEKSASTRNQSTSVLPARNFIPNAEFATSATKIPYWEILVNNQAVKDEKSSFVKDNEVTLGSNQKLRSERISVPSSAELHFSTAQECTAKIILVDKDGNSEEATLPQFPTGDASYLVVEFTGPCQVEKPLLQVVDELGPVEYSYQSHPELANPDARSGAACCPDNYCWNGYACVEPMSTLTTVTEHVADGRDYRCIDGEWKRSVLKFDWNSQQWGFCPQESQCFVLGSGKAEHTAKTFYKGEYPICINSSEYVFDNYCNQGNWTSRTKFLATKLLEVAENDEYVLYCSPYRETLLDLGNNENYLGGEFLVTQKQTQTIGQSLQKPAQPQVLPTCFKDIKLEGKRLVPDSQNTCINNVCVLQYKDGGQFKVAFATTLNKEIDDPKSFLVSLNVPQEKLSQVCQGSGKDFIECNLQGLEFPSSADLYHSDELNAVIFARDGIKLEPGVVDKIVKWFKNLFGTGLLAEKTFVTQAQNFRNVYIANIDGKKVRAVEEIFPGVKQTLVAEYQNFDTPVCEYVKNIKVPPELEVELLEKASGIEKVHCAMNDTVQKVVVNAGLDFFWPQLTGKLRIGSIN